MILTRKRIREAKMADISQKPLVRREAAADGWITLRPETISKIVNKTIKKGDPITIATIGGINATKLTPLLIPLCHPLPIEDVEINCEVHKDRVRVTARVISRGKTGVEMEALTAVTVALLNLWDVVKSYEKDERGQYPTVAMNNIRVVRKVKG